MRRVVRKYIDVDPSVEKEKYVLFLDLVKNRVSITEETDKKAWWAGLAREMGHETKNIRIDGERVIYPPVSSTDHHIGYVPLNKNFKLVEEKIEQKKGLISRFKIEKL